MNKKAYDIYDQYDKQDVRHPDIHLEVKFQVTVGPKNGHIICFKADNPRVKI